MPLNIHNLFTPNAVAKATETLPPLTSTVMDAVFTDRGNHPFPTIGVDEVQRTTRNIPVVRRGSASYNIAGDNRSISIIEPQPVNPSRAVSAKDLNDLKLLDTNSQQIFVRDTIDTFRRIVRSTTEALCAQAITGKISYNAAVAEGITDYVVDFGATKTHTIAATSHWTPGKGTVGDVVAHLVAMSKKIKESGFGGNIIWLAGSEVFIELTKLILALEDTKSVSAKITANGINIAGFEIKHIADTYTNYEDGSSVDVIDPKSVVGISTSAPHRLRYLSIDDVSAGLAATPLYTRVIKTDDPSGYKVLAHSKPLPMPVTSAICSAKVLS